MTDNADIKKARRGMQSPPPAHENAEAALKALPYDREGCINGYIRLALALARKKARRHPNQAEDLEGCALLGLVVAVTRLCNGAGPTLKTPDGVDTGVAVGWEGYIVKTICGFMQDLLATDRQVPIERRALKSFYHAYEPISDELEARPCEAEEKIRIVEEWEGLDLSPADRTFMQLWLDLGNHSEVGRELGISVSSSRLRLHTIRRSLDPNI